LHRKCVRLEIKGASPTAWLRFGLKNRTSFPRHHDTDQVDLFVSPSPRDLEKVRQIRNELGRRGHTPLRFFLKCREAAAARPLEREEISLRPTGSRTGQAWLPFGSLACDACGETVKG